MLQPIDLPSQESNEKYLSLEPENTDSNHPSFLLVLHVPVSISKQTSAKRKMSAIGISYTIAVVSCVLGACFSFVRLYIEWRRLQLDSYVSIVKMWLRLAPWLTSTKERSSPPNRNECHNAGETVNLCGG